MQVLHLRLEAVEAGRDLGMCMYQNRINKLCADLGTDLGADVHIPKTGIKLETV